MTSAGDPPAVARLAVAIVGQHREQADQQAGDALAVHRRFIAAKQMVDMVVTVGQIGDPRFAATA